MMLNCRSLALVLVIVLAASVALVINKKELINHKTEISFVKYNLKDLPEHGISLIAPTDPTLAKSKTLDPYSVFLKNTSSQAVVGYSIKWECFDSKNKSASRNTSYDRYLRSVAEDVSSGITETALAEIRAACPDMSVTVDGVFFADGTFVGPDTIGLFSHVETQMAVRYEVLQKVQSELKFGKTPTEVFYGLSKLLTPSWLNHAERRICPVRTSENYLPEMFWA